MDLTRARTWRGRVFVGISLDGFIARPDSNLDWLTNPPKGIRHAQITSDRRAVDWQAFIPTVDHIVMGRNTYDKVLTFDGWPYNDQQAIVLSRTLPPDGDPRVLVTETVEHAAQLLTDRGAHDVYVDGGEVIQSFLRADMIDEITVAIAPVLIGNGIPLFGALTRDVRLRLKAGHASDGGMTHATYDVIAPGSDVG